MSLEISGPDFDDIADIYWRLGVMSAPSQLHGYLLGLLSVGYGMTGEQWLALAATFIDPVETPAEADSQTLLELLSATQQQLDDGGLALKLLMPDDEIDIAQRVSCLAQWCQGFLAGFALGGKQRQQQRGQQQYSPEISETLSDMATICQAGLGEGDEDEQQRERSYFEICEYLRLAVVSIYLECRQAAANTESGDDGSLHSPSNLLGKGKPGDKLH